MANWAWAAAAAAVAIGGLHPGRASADSGQGASPLADDRTMVALAVALACAEAPEAVPAEPDDAAPADGPELELVATVHAKALKFDVVPKTQVVFSGNTKRKTVWKTERVNLPMHPQPGVVYRDVHVRLTVTSGLEELTALLHEAKRASAGIVLEHDAPASAAAAVPAVAAAPRAAALPPPPPPPPVLVEPAKPAAATPSPTSAPTSTPTPTATPAASPPAPAAAPAAPARTP